MPKTRATLRSELPVPATRSWVSQPVSQRPPHLNHLRAQPAGWVPVKECVPDSTHGNKKPAGNQLCVRIFELASTGLRSLVDFVFFAVVLILS